MTSATETGHTRVPWSERLFEALPVAPIWVGVLIALALLVLFLTLSATLGGLVEFLAGDLTPWEERNARLGLVLVVLAAFLPTAHRYATLGARRNFEALQPLLGGDTETLRELRDRFHRFDARRHLVAGLLGAALAPITGLLVDRDPWLYFHGYYWVAENFWTWLVGTFFCWNLGRFVDTTLEYSGRFTELARSVERIDLFDLSRLAPFARQGLLSALLWVLLPSIFAVNVVDRSFAFPVVILGLICMAVVTAALVLPMLGIHRRIRDEKRAELGRVSEAIRGNPGALADSEIARRAPTATIADLVAYRGLIESRPEWPFDVSMRLRFLLYLAIPLGSWLGGAMVERVLSATLD